MNNPWPALLFGTALVVLGVGFLISHSRSWRRQKQDPSLSAEDMAFFRQRHGRRVKTSSMLAVLGVLIAVGDALLTLPPPPLLVTLYWIGVLVLTGWVILLGLSDMLSTATYAKAEMRRVREQRQELQRQIVEFKHRLGNERGSRPEDRAK